MSGNREAWMALMAAIITLLVSGVVASLDGARANLEEESVAEISAMATERESLLAEIRERADAWRGRGTPPVGDRHIADSRVRISRVHATETEWSMEVEGPPAAIARILGGNLREAHLRPGASSGTLKAHLVHDSSTIPPDRITTGRAARWSRSAL